MPIAPNKPQDNKSGKTKSPESQQSRAFKPFSFRLSAFTSFYLSDFRSSRLSDFFYSKYSFIRSKKLFSFLPGLGLKLGEFCSFSNSSRSSRLNALGVQMLM